MSEIERNKENKFCPEHWTVFKKASDTESKYVYKNTNICI